MTKAVSEDALWLPENLGGLSKDTTGRACHYVMVTTSLAAVSRPSPEDLEQSLSHSSCSVEQLKPKTQLWAGGTHFPPELSDLGSPCLKE